MFAHLEASLFSLLFSGCFQFFKIVKTYLFYIFKNAFSKTSKNFVKKTQSKKSFCYFCHKHAWNFQNTKNAIDKKNAFSTISKQTLKIQNWKWIHKSELKTETRIEQPLSDPHGENYHKDKGNVWNII